VHGDLQAAEGMGVGVLELLSNGYDRFLDLYGRVTLVGLAWFIALYSAFCAVGAAAWRAAFNTAPPSVVAALFSLGVLAFWFSPLALWIVDAVQGGGVFRWSRLRASRGVVLAWGGGLGLLLPLTHSGANDLAQRATIGIVSAACAYVGLRLLDRVTVVHAALGVAGAACTSWFGARAIGTLVASVHRAHLVGHLTAVRADWLPAWIAVGALATGALITTALHLCGRRRGRPHRPASAGGPMAPAVDAVVSDGPVTSDVPPEAYSEEAAEFLRQAGAGADEVAREYEMMAERARHGADTERAVAAMLVVLAARGWSLEASVFIEDERIGDIDFLIAGPSGCRYAIDVKSQDCTVRYDSALGELVLWYGDHERPQTMLATAHRQIDALERHGYGPVEPVICFHCAEIRCPDVVDGVVVIASSALLAWLETTDAQACAAFTELQHR
jgi:hypothetical protein